MKNNSVLFSHQIVVLLKRIIFLLAIFSSTRLLFFVFNLSEFKPLIFVEVIRSFFFGIRFDLSTIYYFNFIFLIFSLLPFPFTKNKVFQNILKALFILVNSILLALNLIDVGYFPIIKRRSGWDMIVMNFTNPETTALLKSYFIGYWHLMLLWIGLIVVLIKYYPSLKYLRIYEFKNVFVKTFTLLFISLLIIAGGFGIARGIEGKPLRLISANDYVMPKYASLVINTPFSIVNTMGHRTLEGDTYYSLAKVEEIYSPIHKFLKQESFNSKNIVIIILESFGLEYVMGHKTKEKNFTPFLDSLISESLFCSNTIANAYNSRDALPAILAGFPSHEGIDFFGSRYSTNTFRSLPAILKELDYETSFFHGGHNGTMSFDKFAKTAGINKYFGFNEYINKKGEIGIDGAWGIFDDNFFQYMVEELDGFSEPFFTSVFSLSSHDPYPIPTEIEDLFPEGKLQILKSIAYTDYALKRFFKAIKNKPWYKNTLFIIVADHTSKSVLPQYKTHKNSFAIPLLFYSPSDSSLNGEFVEICQQTDIMPSVLDYINYNKAFVAFGNSIFQNSHRYAVNYIRTNYNFVDSSNVLVFDGQKSNALFNYKTDSLDKENLLSTKDSLKLSLEYHLKAYIQNYKFRMINNQLADTISIVPTIHSE